MQSDLWHPLGFDVVKGGGRDEGEANKEDIGLGIGQRSQLVVILLYGSIPESQLEWFLINHHSRRIIIEDSGNIFSRESICCVTDKKAGFSYSSISNYYALD